MGRRDYEMEDATKAVEGQVSEPIVRALLVVRRAAAKERSAEL
jgi:hypothetical protein